MASYEEVLNWCREMGYPNAGCPSFQANLRKLTPVQMKNIWLHLVRHVRPANEVAAKRKRLLVYKLRVEGNPTQEILDKFESVSDYEAYLKGKELKDKIKYIDFLIEDKKKQITFFQTKSKECAENLRIQAIEEKDKVEKTRLLKMKRLELEHQVAKFKELNNLLGHFVQPMYSWSYEYETQSSQELKDFLRSLTPGQELKQMCEHLQCALSTGMTIQNPSSKTEVQTEELEIFHDTLAQHFSSLIFKLKELNRKIRNKREEMDAKKGEIIRQLSSSSDLNQRARAGVMQTFFDSGHLEKVYNAAEAKFLSDWLNHNGSLYNGNQSNLTSIAELDDEISVLNSSVVECIEDIISNSRIPAETMSTTLEDSFAKMRSNAAICLPKVEKFGSVVQQLTSDVPKLVALFLKSPSNPSSTDKQVCSFPEEPANGVVDQDEIVTRFLLELLSKLKDNEGDLESLGPQIRQQITQRLTDIAQLNDEVVASLTETKNRAGIVREHLDSLEKHPLWKVLPQNDFQSSLFRVNSLLQKLSPETQRNLLARLSSEDSDSC